MTNGTLQAPRWWMPSELRKAGLEAVTDVGAFPTRLVRLYCLTSRASWEPRRLDSGQLAEDHWLCPQGCNGPGQS